MQKIVIVGGGAIGSSIAYHLAVHPRFRGSVTVVERDPTYSMASSSLSASSIREQFSTPLNIAMSQFGLAFLRNAADALAVEGDRPQLGLRLPGYLFLASEAGMAVLRANHEVQKAAGADVALLEPAALKARFPWLSTDGVVAGSLGLSREGWFDGPALLQAFRRKARSLGVTYVAQDAAGFEQAGGRVTGVRLPDGTVLACDLAVNAAGPWSARVASFLGIDLPVRARKRMVFVIACPDKLPDCPLLIDPTGIWLRPEGAGFICGRSPGDGEDDPDEPPLEVDETMFHERIWPVLAERVPALERLKITGSWAGYYELNLFDHNGVVGPHPATPNVIFATGFSGHGMQHSPAVGRGVAELIADGSFTTLDLSPLALSRLVEGRKLVERNIV
ncbi:NAD(P)/FAD-dependent oxidoreductase [Limobrevibacterium gyesilva]|uniref:FAD-binding oxidoreductase n=1 Tax=Limobrevibacterium gyesilva TaxID=2991712 RepID=A0AA41YKZ4_9PROT|nr:FAD-binding oxidoreductase [Limobrevibacterium gyesilva]MCW3475314.1 FAD-binding oxidoreductase [Limobrevibacterium gyesilva]